MAYLSFISDEDLLQCIAELHNTYEQCQRAFTTADFYKNKVDPIKFQFDMAFNGINDNDYIKAEITRQVDKTISNAIGDFHQRLLGCIDGLNDLGVGNGCDLVNDQKTIFAELKNKHNTMNSSSSEATIQKLIHFAEKYPNATCYWIQIIAKRSIDELWEGSFNGKHYAHPRVRKISADRFYALVTGIPDAFYQLCSVLPQATKDYLDSLNNNSQGKTESASVYSELNSKAQQNGKTLIEQIMADNFETYTGFNQ
jgi:hypothetical protein